MLAKRGLAWRNRWNTSGTPGTPTVLAKRGLACWNTSKSTSSINSRKYREIPGTWHVSPERGLTEQIQLFYRGRPAAALQRCTRCTRSTGCSAAAAAAPAAALLLQLAARRCCCSSLQLAAAAARCSPLQRAARRCCCSSLLQLAAALHPLHPQHAPRCRIPAVARGGGLLVKNDWKPRTQRNARGRFASNA